jgi:hypothetical protein
MMRREASIVIAALLVAGCSALGGSTPASVEIGPRVSAAPTYIAPTLPPENTLTPTPTKTATPPPTPTPFQVVTLAATEPSGSEPTPTATPALFVGQWEEFESARLNTSIRIPPQLDARDFGQSILIGNSNLEASLYPLFMEVRFDQAGSYRLPEGIDATNPRNVLEALVHELEQTYTEVQLVRPIQDVNFNGIGAAEVSARVSLITATAETNLNWYLAVAIRDETVVRFYASSPASAGVTYMTVAGRIADSFSFIE